MAKKRKTLPKNFDELIEAGDLDAIKEVFEKSELNATGGYAKGTALSFWGISDEATRWLVEQGADIDAVDTYKRTPLHRHAMIRRGEIQLLLELGADKEATDCYGDTPLHMAAGNGNFVCVKQLIDHQADLQRKNQRGDTPLAYGLARTQNIDIPNMAKIADLLIEAGAEVTPEMKESVVEIGESFEFHRENFNPDDLQETDAALTHLYETFGVTPVKKRQMHDGISPITLAAGTWEEQYSQLWDFLIPSNGPAQTVQGEVVRITGKVRGEIYRNGGGNWGKDFRKMLDALLVHLRSGTPLEDSLLEEAAMLVKEIRSTGDGDDEPTRLCELAVHWVTLNPAAVMLKEPDYKI